MTSSPMMVWISALAPTSTPRVGSSGSAPSVGFQPLGDNHLLLVAAGEFATGWPMLRSGWRAASRLQRARPASTAALMKMPDDTFSIVAMETFLRIAIGFHQPLRIAITSGT